MGLGQEGGCSDSYSFSVFYRLSLRGLSAIMIMFQEKKKQVLSRTRFSASFFFLGFEQPDRTDIDSLGG